MFNKSSIAKRLAIGFGIVLVLLLVVATTGYWGMQSVTQETTTILHRDYTISQLADEAKFAILELRRYEKDTELNMDDKTAMNGYQEKWKAELAIVRSKVSDLKPMVASSDS